MREGPYRCVYCGTVYAEYVNGCPWCYNNLGAVHGTKPYEAEKDD